MHMQKVKAKGHSIQKLELKQTHRRTEAIASPVVLIAVGKDAHAKHASFLCARRYASVIRCVRLSVCQQL